MEYNYDELNRLIYSSKNDGEEVVNYIYDSLGNLVTEAVSAGNETQTTEYSYNSLNQLIRKLNGSTETLYNYDGRGNLVEKIETNTAEGLVGTLSAIPDEVEIGEENQEEINSPEGNGEEEIDLPGVELNIPGQEGFNALKTSGAIQLPANISFDLESLDIEGASLPEISEPENPMPEIPEPGEGLDEETGLIEDLPEENGSEETSVEDEEGRDATEGIFQPEEKLEVLNASLLPDRVTTYAYDTTNRMVNGINPDNEESAYTYNGLGDLVGHEADTINKDYILDWSYGIPRALTELDSDGKEINYLYGLTKISAEIKMPGGLEEGIFFNQDRLGSDIYITDASGAIKSYTEYGTWGEPTKLYDDGDLDIPASYTGHAYDEVLGLYHAKARMYDAVDRRMLSQDSHWNPDNMLHKYFVQGNIKPSNESISQSSNLYMYALDNPLKYTDPTGKEAAEKLVEAAKQLAEIIYVDFKTGKVIAREVAEGLFKVTAVTGAAPVIFKIGAILALSVFSAYGTVKVKEYYTDITGEEINVLQAFAVALAVGACWGMGNCYR
jgi:RHS repeat-associated protein